MAHEAIRAVGRGRTVGTHYYSPVPSIAERRHRPVAQRLRDEFSRQCDPRDRRWKRARKERRLDRARHDEQRVQRDHYAVMNLADFDRAMLECAASVAARAIELEHALDDKQREDDQIRAERDDHVSEITTSTVRARPRIPDPSRRLGRSRRALLRGLRAIRRG